MFDSTYYFSLNLSVIFSTGFFCGMGNWYWYSWEENGIFAIDRKLGSSTPCLSCDQTAEQIFIANTSTRNNVIWAWCSILNGLPQLVHLHWFLFLPWIQLRHWLQLQDKFLLGRFWLLGGSKTLNAIGEVLKDGHASLQHGHYKLISSTQNTFLLYVVTILENIDSNAILTC